MLNRITIWGFLIALFASSLVFETPVCTAQITGYINGTQSLTSFDAETGALVNSFSTGGTGQAFAVALNDTTLYLPSGPAISPGALNIVNGLNGQFISTIPLGQPGSYAQKAVITSQGGTAFVSVNGNGSLAPRLVAVNLSTLAVVATLPMSEFTRIDDIVLSPDDTTLYASLTCGQICVTTPSACPVYRGICAFNTRTMALKGTSAPQQLHGPLAVSQDSKSLYITNDGTFYVADGSSLIAKYSIPTLFYTIGPAVVSNGGHYAIILAGPNAQASTTAYTLDTSTNKIVAELFANAPMGGQTLSGTGSVAFGPSGHSVWMLMAGGATGVTLAEVAFPSGLLLQSAPVPSDSSTVAFPRVTAK